MRDFPRISIEGVLLFRRLTEMELRTGFSWARAERPVDEFPRRLQFFAGKPKLWRPDVGIPDAEFFLYEFDELNKLRDRIETQQRQEPAIQLERKRILISLNVSLTDAICINIPTFQCMRVVAKLGENTEIAVFFSQAKGVHGESMGD